VTFHLLNRSAQTSALYAWVSYPRRWKYYPGISVAPGMWDVRRQRVKIQHPQHALINRLLAKIEDTAVTLWYEGRSEGKVLTRENIRQALDEQVNPQPVTKDLLVPFIEKLIHDRSSAKYKRNTIQNYRVACARIKEYNPELTFEDITLDFFYDFLRHLQAKGYKQNTIQSTIKNLKVFMNDARDRGLTTNENHLHKKFSVAKQEVENVYLSEAELDRLYQYRFDSEKLRLASDLFLVMCWTGVRYSDLKQVTLKNMQVIGDQDCLVIRMEKTEEWVTIPLHPIVMSILHKYNFQIDLRSSQKINQYIKEACQIAGIQDWQKVSTHTGRRSMVCNLYLAGFPETTIMKISGHKSYAAFKTYVNKLTRSDHVKVASKFWNNQKGIMKAI
jgi:integrase